MPSYYVRVPRHELPHVSSSSPTANVPSSSPPPQQPIDPDLDEEGLSKTGYDVVLCGTGLVQSILASALARAGKSVLHCDGNDHYGEMDAVLSLDHLAEWAQKHTITETETDADAKYTEPSIVVESRAGAAGGEPECNTNADDALSDQDVIIDLDPAGGCAGLVVHSCTSLSDDEKNADDWLRVGVEVVTDLGEARIVALPTESSPQLTVSLANEQLTAANNAETPPTDNDETEESKENDSNQEEADPTPEKLDPTLAHFEFTDSNEQLDDPRAITRFYQRHHNIWTKSAKLRDDILRKWGRSFALDLTPGLIYATGDAVNGLIKSGVADYLEFKSAEAICLLMEPIAGGRKQPRGGTRATASTRVKQKREDNAKAESESVTASSELQLSRVPCSKGDVFQTKLLSPVEKRRLMKFLQLASDYAVSIEAAKVGGDEKIASGEGENAKSDDDSGADRQVAAADESAEADNIQSLNERQLLQGRSLTRPQNKVVSTTDLDILRDYIDREVDFDEYLQTVHSLPERLRMIVIHAMAMESASASSPKADGDADPLPAGYYPTGRAMADLCRHLLSLGRYGGTAFLVPMYGSGELSQSFCRSAAVHGATYLLRRPAKGLASTPCKETEGIVVNGVVLGSDVDPSGKYIPEKIVRAKRVIVPSESLPLGGMPVSSRRIVRRVSILSDKLIVDSATDDDSASLEQRHIIVVPPNTGKIGNEYVIHGIALDESVSIAPRSTACTVLHLTTTCYGSKGEEIKCHAALETVAQSLINGKKIQEMYQCSFSFASHDGLSGGIKKLESSLEGLTYCQKGGQSITLEAAFHQARQIFDDVCPNADFLALSKEMDEMVRERTGDRGDDSDDEQIVLESAMDLIDSSTNAANNEST
jgi:RAB protein geranylgeranyltransferase component A